MADADAIFNDLFGGKGPAPAAAPPAAESTVKPAMPAALNAALQGASFGFSDEATAYLRSITGGPSYTEGVKAERDQLKQFRSDNPATAIGLEVAGAIPTMLVPLGWAGRALQAARGVFGLARGAAEVGQATNLGRVATTAAVGAAQGGAAGFGAGEGDPYERLTGALLGAGAGMVGGGAMQTLAQVSPRLAGEMVAMFRQPPPADEARRLVQRALEADGVTPDRIMQIISASPRAGMETAADVAGPTTRGLAESGTNIPGAGRGEAQAFLNERAGAATARIREDAGRLLGVGDRDYFTTVDAISQRQRAAAAPLYEQAYAAAPIPTSEISDLATDPAFLKAYRKGMDMLDREARAEGRPLMPRQIDQMAAVPVQAIDAVARGLGSMIGVAKKAGDDKLARSYTMLKDAVLQRADSLVPEYAAARQAWAGPADLLDAAELGRSFTTMRPNQMAEELRGRTESELDAFRLGVMDSLGQALDKGRDGANMVRKIFASPEQRAQLRVAFPSADAFNEFASIMEREATFAETAHEVLGNSRTAVRLEGQRQLTAPVVPDTSNIAGRLVAALRSSDVNTREAVAREIVQTLVRPNPVAARMQVPPRMPAGVAAAVGRGVRAFNPVAGVEAGNLLTPQ